MNKMVSLQELVLNELKKNEIPVAIYLVNGIKLEGRIEAFDQYVLILKNDKSGISQMVYKHAISTILPQKACLSLVQSDETLAGACHKM